jgi:hypothetical protein
MGISRIRLIPINRIDNVTSNVISYFERNLNRVSRMRVFQGEGDKRASLIPGIWWNGTRENDMTIRAYREGPRGR